MMYGGCLLALLAASAMPAAAAETEHLIASAHAIAVVEIVATDYSATAADGPMYAEARVLKAIKGSLAARRIVRFGASAWVGPSYRRSERRIVFLQRLPRGHNYFTRAQWSSLDAGRVDWFINEKNIGACSETALREFAKTIRKERNRPLRLEFVPVKDRAGNN